MTTELLEIKPRELKFTFELKKQSSCSIVLSNKSDQCVAFKVKTTSPKKYSVRPTVGIIRPKSTCDFTVTMQAQQVAPPDMQCKDKFLIQSTAVPFGISENDIVSDMFAKDSGKYVEEKKIRVVLVSPVQSPVLLPINGELNEEPLLENSVPKDRAPHGVENIPPSHMSPDVAGGLEAVKEMSCIKAMKDVVSRPLQDSNDLNLPQNIQKINFTDDFEYLKSKIVLMDSKLKEAELTINKLTEERRITTREKDQLTRELELLRKNEMRKVQAGFPFLFVCMVALISLTLGYLVHT